MKDPDWFNDAACKGYPTEWWFPTNGSGGREAIAICWQCPVRKECLQWAIDTNERDGIFGGVREGTRTEMRRAANRRRKARRAS